MERRTFLALVPGGLLAAPLAAEAQKAAIGGPPRTPVDPPGGTNPIPTNTWTMIPTLPGGTPLTKRAGKHQRVVYDTARERHLIFGGDRLDSDLGQPAVEAFDSLTGGATLLSPTCVPPPGLMPNFPDNIATCYDSTRDRVLMFKGFYGISNFSKYPAATVTPAATSGTNVLITASANVFEPWHVGRTSSGVPFKLQQVSAALGTTILAEGTIVEYVSPTQLRLTITKAFATTNPIESQFWRLGSVLHGMAARHCGRNDYAGDLGVLNDDIIFNCATHQWERKTWPTSPLGLGSDGAGPGWAAYDEASDSAYLVSKPGGSHRLSILHCASNTWEIVTFGAGTLIRGANSYRAQIQVADGQVHFMSNKTGAQCLIRYTIATRTWRAWAVPEGYGAIPDDAEPQLVYDPVSKVLLHPWHNELTSTVGPLYIFRLASETWETRTVPGLAEPVKGGCATWDPKTHSMLIWGRKAAGMPGYACYHYRYAP